MRERTFNTGFLIAVVVCLLVPGGWAQQPKPGGTLRVAYESDVSGLDPHVFPGIQAWPVVGNLFNSLLTIALPGKASAAHPRLIPFDTGWGFSPCLGRSA